MAVARAAAGGPSNLAEDVLDRGPGSDADLGLLCCVYITHVVSVKIVLYLF